jgi:DNA-binding MarR family transcriptional regulator
MSASLSLLHGALMDIVGFINRPQPDRALLREAGVALDRALFPLLVVIERRGPIGIVDLADFVGRDHTTVSRQVAKLEGLKLVVRRAGKADRRVREATVTAKGKTITDAIDAARQRMATSTLAAWNERDLKTLARLLRRLADDLPRRGERTG